MMKVLTSLWPVVDMCSAKLDPGGLCGDIHDSEFRNPNIPRC
jgi:hypothetical protein